MKVYKYTFIGNILVSLVSAIVSWYFRSSVSVCGKWIENIAIGIFASAILLVGSSLIGYLVEERKICVEYYWKLQSLRSKVLALSTIPLERNTAEEYCNVIVQINEILLGYFSMVEQHFILDKYRKKVQKLLEIQEFLHEYYVLSIGAETKFREYIAGTKDKNGNRNYSKEKLRNDIKKFTEATDNFKETGHPFVIYLDTKISEYHEYIKKN